jgi:hypothetical protein
MAGVERTAEVDSERVLELVNLARSTYGADELESLLPGQPLSASFCPLGRSLRSGVGDWLFVAVGTKHLRLWTLGKDPASVARGILGAWELPHKRLKKSAEGAGFAVIPLPSELSEFVIRFDQGLLLDYQAKVDGDEVRRLSELARKIPLPRGRKAGAGVAVDLSGSHAGIWQKTEPPPGLPA